MGEWNEEIIRRSFQQKANRAEAEMDKLESVKNDNTANQIHYDSHLARFMLYNRLSTSIHAESAERLAEYMKEIHEKEEFETGPYISVKCISKDRYIQVYKDESRYIREMINNNKL